MAGGFLISSSPLRLFFNYDKHAVCQPTPMNVAGHKPDDYLPPPPPPPKIIEEMLELLPVPLDTTDLTSSLLTPNGSYHPALSLLFCIVIEPLFYPRPLYTGDTNKPRRLSLPDTVAIARSQVEKVKPADGTGRDRKSLC